MRVNKRIVIIETPFAGDVESNLTYGRECMRDSLLRGEAPFASHLLYTQDGVLDDNVADQRELGITSGFAFKHIPDALTVFYIDRGMSQGMKQALWYCMDHGLPIEYRRINEVQTEAIDA